MNSNSYEDYCKKSEQVLSLLHNIFQINFILTIIPQKPLDNSEVIIEIEVLLEKRNVRKKIIYTEYLQLMELKIDGVEYLYSTVNYENYKNLQNLSFQDLYSKICFHHIELYGHQLIRMWNYIGNILGLTNINNNFTQNYQLLNNIRYENFKKNLVQQFPASTGIGIDAPGLIVRTISMKENASVTIIPIDNKYQTNAFDYSDEILIGDGQKHPPLFERALLIKKLNSEELYISGTASIIGQNSKGINDIRIQTKTILTNIETLIEQAKKISIREIEFKIKEFIVYIKKSTDFQIVKKIVEETLKDLPIIYTQADVCRNELLVEMECICE
ncbi:MAG: hypothetical protein ACPL1A_04935 [Candidatus Kapaibacteriota bacterium]